MRVPRSYLSVLVPLAAVLSAPSIGVAQSATASEARSDAAARPVRWQAALHDGSYVWELERATLRGDTLVGVQGDTVVRVPLRVIDELRLLAGSEARLRQADGAKFGALGGSGDAVYVLGGLALAERRSIVARALAAQDSATAPPGGRARP